MKKIKNILIKFFIIFCLMIFIWSFAILKSEYAEYKEIKNDMENLEDEAISYENNNIKIDWDYLKKVNSDIIGWIYIEGTNINYPILNDDGSQYYLYHSYNKKYTQNGSIFTFESNLFDNQKTIIYGHNMRNNLMFSQLEKYMDEDFFRNYSIIKIYTPNYNYEADIFSVYFEDVYTENENIENLNFPEEVAYYKQSSIYETDYENQISKIIKLITCSYEGVKEFPTNQRYFIIANLYERKIEN